MPKAKNNGVRSSKSVAKKASSLLRNSSSKQTRSVAASALANRKKSSK